jgi:hypothetical protein
LRNQVLNYLIDSFRNSQAVVIQNVNIWRLRGLIGGTYTSEFLNQPLARLYIQSFRIPLFRNLNRYINMDLLSYYYYSSYFSNKSRAAEGGKPQRRADWTLCVFSWQTVVHFHTVKLAMRYKQFQNLKTALQPLLY